MKPTLFLSFLLLSLNIFAQKTILSDTIPLIFNDQNTFFVKAVFDKTDTLNLNFDTGTTELVLINDVLKNKLKSAPQLYTTLYNLQIGSTSYKTKVYDAQLTVHGSDGRFGWDLFKDKVVELNFDKKMMIVHAALPNEVASDDKFAKLKIEFFKDLFFIESEIKQSGIVNKNLFLFDTGYQRTAMLSSDLLKAGKFPVKNMEVIKKVIMHGALGNEIPVITSNLKTLKIGKYSLRNVPVQITNANKPLKDLDVHILGNEVLKRFNVFLDFQTNFVYLKPNTLFKDKYMEEKKNGI
ncbi:retroviral-like aspartic protease family protein [Pedobacter paludis]|uniref:Clan AA aspartic protease n=1 Tax=Pedobacter paludis TaxID=2203212 RepID=A0A317ESF2_9SPHI|nr:retroviral-like aspartic protease family protein [Pedobacter paludis]PWS29870.1 clan AA aspartic protease [Pedobacter paludis]